MSLLVLFNGPLVAPTPPLSFPFGGHGVGTILAGAAGVTAEPDWGLAQTAAPTHTQAETPDAGAAGTCGGRRGGMDIL